LEDAEFRPEPPGDGGVLVVVGGEVYDGTVVVGYLLGGEVEGVEGGVDEVG